MAAADFADELYQFAVGYETAYDDIREHLDVEDRARLLAAIDHCRGALKEFYDEVESDLLADAGEKQFVVEGLGTVEIKQSNDYREWQHDDVARRLVALALDERYVDLATGDFEPREQAVARVLMECAGVGYWRLGALRAHGLDPDEYAHRERRWKVKLPRASR